MDPELHEAAEPAAATPDEQPAIMASPFTVDIEALATTLLAGVVGLQLLGGFMAFWERRRELLNPEPTPKPA